MAATQQQLPDLALSSDMRRRIRQQAQLMRSFHFPSIADTILMLDEALTVRERQLKDARKLLELAVDSGVARGHGVVVCAHCTAELREDDLVGEHAGDCWVGRVQTFLRGLDGVLPAEA